MGSNPTLSAIFRQRQSDMPGDDPTAVRFPFMIASILWRRLDQPGHEFARLRRRDEGWLLAGTAVGADAGEPYRLDYRIRCDAQWRTLEVGIEGIIGTREVALRVAVDEARRWFVDGVHCAALAGCLDIDLGFSPSTNLLPIRRLGLTVGAEAPVCAAWLRFPHLVFEPLEQGYRRLAARRYGYESSGGRFRAELDVDDAGFVVRYPGLWERVAAGSGRS